MQETRLTLRANAPIGTISPRLYGHFAEHLGRCCYDGLWVGTDETAIDHQHGFRTDVLQALRALPVPLLRWPGGCYADHYHWMDGIGPHAERPVRIGISCDLQVEDRNSLGTHEFLNFCSMIGAEPYLAGNVGSGSVQELCDWLEYCNSSVPTTLARKRAVNGAPEPFGVRLWGVGNENWGCGGNYDAATYAGEFRRYATMLRHVDPSAELVVCGHDDAWNETLLATLGKHLRLADHLSIHQYWIGGGPEVDFTDQEYYDLLAEADATEDFIIRTRRLIEAANPGEHVIGIALDEWGVWHPEARPWGARSTAECRNPVTYEQANTLRDALAAAIAFEGFHRQCDVLTMANIAQIVNVLQSVIMTEGPTMWLTPTYHIFRMHAPHIGAEALPIWVDGGTTLPGGGAAVSATASRSANGYTVTITNRHLHASSSVVVTGIEGGEATGEILTAEDPRAINSANNPEHVAPRSLAVARDGTGYRIELPPHSVATITIRPGS